MKKNKYIGITMLVATMLTVTSCSEFDDYNKAVSDNTVSGNQTLWENIQQNVQLKDFASLIKKSGFDSELNATQYYTVWAPLDGTFDPTPYQQMDATALMRQFVKNHIASYGHHASGNLNDRILMLNDKSYNFTGNGSYQFGGVEVTQANLPNDNGVMHLLKGVATYYPNIYEYVTDSVLAKGKDLDSLRNYIRRFEKTYLDEEHSVEGPIVNGQRTYIDSVMITENTLWSSLSLNVKMNNEDSTYTILLPTNKAWNAMCEKVKSSFNYIPATTAKTFTGNTKSADFIIQPAIHIDNAYWQDSIANSYVTRYLSYSNNNGYNKWLVGAPTTLGTDTLYTTTRQKMSNPKDIIGQTIETIKMSNGVGRIVDSLAIKSWETYSPEFKLSATNVKNIGQYLNSTMSTVNVTHPNRQLVDLSEQTSSTYSYLLLEPSSNRSKAELTFYLRNVISTTYDIYCIFVPERVNMEKDDAVTLPNRVIFTLNYCDVDGSLKDKVFLDEDPDKVAEFKAKYKLSDGTTTNYNTNRAFTNDTSKVDTLYVGEFKFPVCYYGLGDNYCPSLNISSPFSTNTGQVRNDYYRGLRIAGIILKPKDLVEFEEKKK